MELAAVQIPVHVGVGEENLRGAAFDDYVENVRAAQLVERLGREHHRRVVLAPGLERLDDISLNAWVLEKHPRLVDEERLESGSDLLVRDDRVRPMENVEKQRFENLGILAHLLEVEALEPGERDRVFGVIEEKSELAALRPLRKAFGKAVPENVRENAQRSQRRIDGIEILDLVVEVALGRRIKLQRSQSLASGPSGTAPENRDFPWWVAVKTG